MVNVVLSIASIGGPSRENVPNEKNCKVLFNIVVPLWGCHTLQNFINKFCPMENFDNVVRRSPAKAMEATDDKL